MRFRIDYKKTSRLGISVPMAEEFEGDFSGLKRYVAYLKTKGYNELNYKQL